jgi:hypothetical protein
MNRQPDSRSTGAIVCNATRQVFGNAYNLQPGSYCSGRRMVLRLEQIGSETSSLITLTARPLSQDLQGMAQIVRGHNGRMRGISTSIVRHEARWSGPNGAAQSLTSREIGAKSQWQ